MRPSPNHGTLWLHSDDHDDYYKFQRLNETMDMAGHISLKRRIIYTMQLVQRPKTHSVMASLRILNHIIHLCTTLHTAFIVLVIRLLRL